MARGVAGKGRRCRHDQDGESPFPDFLLKENSYRRPPLQLLFKPKTAKSATPTPVLVLAREDTETSAAAIGKLLNLKELRVASEELMRDVMPGVEGKDDRQSAVLPQYETSFRLLMPPRG